LVGSAGYRCCRPQVGNRVKQLTAVPDNAYAKVLQVLRSQGRQNFVVDLVVAECRRLVAANFRCPWTCPTLPVDLFRAATYSGQGSTLTRLEQMLFPPKSSRGARNDLKRNIHPKSDECPFRLGRASLVRRKRSRRGPSISWLPEKGQPIVIPVK
jgi:hypothetical protein